MVFAELFRLCFIGAIEATKKGSVLYNMLESAGVSVYPIVIPTAISTFPLNMNF